MALPQGHQPRRHRRPFSILGAIAFAVCLLSGDRPHIDLALHPLADSAPVIAALLAVAGAAFGFCLPTMKVRSLGQVWRLPYHTFLLPRWLVCLIGTQLVGLVITQAIVAWETQPRRFDGLVIALPATVLFLLSATRRFRRDPRGEYAWRYRIAR